MWVSLYLCLYLSVGVGFSVCVQMCVSVNQSVLTPRVTRVVCYCNIFNLGCISYVETIDSKCDPVTCGRL